MFSPCCFSSGEWEDWLCPSVVSYSGCLQCILPELLQTVPLLITPLNTQFEYTICCWVRPWITDILLLVFIPTTAEQRRLQPWSSWLFLDVLHWPLFLLRTILSWNHLVHGARSLLVCVLNALLAFYFLLGFLDQKEDGLQYDRSNHVWPTSWGITFGPHWALLFLGWVL